MSMRRRKEKQVNTEIHSIRRWLDGHDVAFSEGPGRASSQKSISSIPVQTRGEVATVPTNYINEPPRCMRASAACAHSRRLFNNLRQPRTFPDEIKSILKSLYWINRQGVHNTWSRREGGRTLRATRAAAFRRVASSPYMETTLTCRCPALSKSHQLRFCTIFRRVIPAPLSRIPPEVDFLF